MEKVKLIKKVNGDWQINPKLSKSTDEVADHCIDMMDEIVSATKAIAATLTGIATEYKASKPIADIDDDKYDYMQAQHEARERWDR